MQTDSFSERVVLALIYRALLDAVYVAAVGPTYAYMGLTLELDLFEYALSIVLMLMPLFVLDSTNGKPSVTSLLVLYLIVIVPLSSFFALSNHASNTHTLLFFVACVLCFMLVCFICRVLTFRGCSTRRSVKMRYLIPVLSAAALATLIYVVSKGGLHIKALDFSQVYAIRESQVEFGTVMGYIIVWCFRVVCPLLMLHYLSVNRKGPACFWFAVQVMFYLVLANKEILLAPLVIWIVYYLSKRIGVYKALIAVVLLGAFAASVLHFAVNVNYLLGVVPVRLLYIPAQIAFEYHDFFRLEGFLNYSGTHLSLILGTVYPYGDSTPGNIIAMYYQGAVSNSNTGYLASAYSNGGYICMFVESIILAFCLAGIDALASTKKKGELTAIALLPILFSLSNNSLTSVMLGGGLLLFILIVFLGADSLFEFDYSSVVSMRSRRKCMRDAEDRSPHEAVLSDERGLWEDVDSGASG